VKTLSARYPLFVAMFFVVSAASLHVACRGAEPIEGRVSVTVADDFENNRSERFYGLTSDEGVSYELLFDETDLQQEMLSLINLCFGGSARVTGRVLDGEEIHVRSIEFVHGPTRESTTEDRFARCGEQVGEQVGP
jgi:hypothetical protein